MRSRHIKSSSDKGFSSGDGGYSGGDNGMAKKSLECIVEVRILLQKGKM